MGSNVSQIQEKAKGKITGKLLSSHSFSTFDVIANVVGLILIGMILFFSYDGLNNRSFMGDVYFLKGDLVIPTEDVKIIVFFCIAIFIMFAIQTFCWYKMYLNIYDDMIYGKSKVSILAKDFAIKTEDIIDVNVKTSISAGCNLVITTKTQKYKLLISNKQVAYDTLKKIIDERKAKVL